MPKIVFTQNIQRHVCCPETVVGGETVREALDHLFRDNQQARSYVLDDQGALRRHMSIFLDGRLISDRTTLSDPVAETSTIYVFQALSGG